MCLYKAKYPLSEMLGTRCGLDMETCRTDIGDDAQI